MVEPSGTEKQKWHFDDDFTIRNEDGMVLDVQKGSKEAGTKVIAFKKHGGPNQKFRVVPINKIKQYTWDPQNGGQLTSHITANSVP